MNLIRLSPKVAINVPVYQDVNTPRGQLEDLSQYGDDGSSQAAAKPDHIYMDAMGFGMGLSCLQVTFQACNIKEAESLYDQVRVLLMNVILIKSIDNYCSWLHCVQSSWPSRLRHPCSGVTWPTLIVAGTSSVPLSTAGPKRRGCLEAFQSRGWLALKAFASCPPSDPA